MRTELMAVVSIIVPIYKSEKCIVKAVESVLMQSYSDFELLLIDDGSPDNSLAVCKSLAERDNRIKVFHKDNGGICSARNLGIEKSTGKYIAFLDHDDEYLPNYLEDNINLLEKNQADIVKFGKIYRVIDEFGNGIDYHDERLKSVFSADGGIAVFTGTEIVDNYVSIRNAVKTMYIWDGIYSAELIKSNGLIFDTGFKFGHEDILFNTGLYSNAKCVVINTKEYFIHNYDEKVSTSSIFNYSRIDDSIKAAKAESDMLFAWNVQPGIILEGYMDEFFRLMNIINFRGSNLSFRQKKEIMNTYLLQTLKTMPYVKKAIKDLYRKNKKAALWAWCLNNRLFALVYFMEKCYRLIAY